MKGLAKIIGIILGILGLSSKATSVKKSKIKKIDKQVEKVKTKTVKPLIKKQRITKGGKY